MTFKIIGEVHSVKTIAAGRAIRNLPRLRKVYGAGRWRKMKGLALLSFNDGTQCEAEVHWYEAHGIGKKEIKIKRLLGEN